jgi:3-methyladenine DNA glycosylase AlkD
MVADWVNSGTTLWQRRAALVAFVNLAPKGMHSQLILDTAAVLVQDQERFSQTGVGWVLRSLSDAYPDKVFDFLEEHQEHVSLECMRMATARLSDKKRKALGVTGKRKRR